MKALELINYPRICTCPKGECGDKSVTCLVHGHRATYLAKKKRFTDAELAAEFYYARAVYEMTKFNEVSSVEEFSDERWAMIEGPLDTLYRFATLTHYDEPTL